MAKFNKLQGHLNVAGGISERQSNELELASILLTSFVKDLYYRSSHDVLTRLEHLVQVCDLDFVLRAIIYARREFGMRSITHAAASFVCSRLSGHYFGTAFYDLVVRRVDDMTEIAAFHFNRGQKLSNSMKRGFASAIGRFSPYQLAKYRGTKGSVKLIDLINLCHPTETKVTAGALGQLVRDELRSFDTWEVEISAVGDNASKKKDIWMRLLSEGKLGYMALLRNIRNIVDLRDDELSIRAFAALQDASAIKRSLVLPFRFLSAYKSLKGIDNAAVGAISSACDLACSNVPEFSGKTLVALDVSGSMTGQPSDIGGLFASIFGKRANCDIMTFDTRANFVSFNPTDSVFSIFESIDFKGGGTNFDCIFNQLLATGKSYDRIIILSDMQGWGNVCHANSQEKLFNQYKQEFGDCKIYSFDLNSYGTMMFPEENVYCLAGYSDKIFDIMSLLENDREALLNTIKNYRYD